MKEILWLLICAALGSSPAVLGKNLNGFDLDNSLVPVKEIKQGGPPRDGIPALSNTTYRFADKVDFLSDSDIVLGLEHTGLAKAYPVRVLVWHEIVNTDFHGAPVAVTFCPLCGTGLAFSASLDGQNLEFGVSGLLHNSDLLMYDRQTDSLWSQIPGKAIAGPMAGKSLERLPVMHLTWSEWKERYPDSLVMTLDTGHNRDYDRTPYAGYEKTEKLYFPVSNQDRRYHTKTWVLGLEKDGEARAWPFPELAKTSGRVSDCFAGQPVTIAYNHDSDTAVAYDAEGEILPAVRAYWFAWFGFYPFTEVYEAEQ